MSGVRRLSYALLLLLSSVPASAAVPVIDLPAKPLLRFAVVGDAGENAAPVAAGVAAVSKRTPIDGILLVGDNVYPCGVSSVDDPHWSRITPITAIGIPVYPVLGNHDYGEPGAPFRFLGGCSSADPAAQVAASASIPSWHFPARSYRLRGEFVDIAMIDTEPVAIEAKSPVDGSVTAAEMRAETDAMLAAPAKWHFAVGHHTIVSSGWHGHFPRRQVRAMRTLLPMFRARHLDLYMCGHDHHLELIDGRPWFLISGAGSDPVPSLALGVHTLYPTDTRLGRGFAVVEVTATTLSVSFYDVGGKRIGGPFVKTK